MKINNQNMNNIQQQSFNNMDGNRNYQQEQNNNQQRNDGQNNNNNNEPVNPFLFSGNEGNTNDENADQQLENVKQVGSITDISPVKDICFI
ncbi:MAG: hypothetical protein K0R07_1514, partial [Sedimentibacter sp.]|nr:hypothetical protein [Sedimentibacter sp.]